MKLYKNGKLVFEEPECLVDYLEEYVEEEYGYTMMETMDYIEMFMDSGYTLECVLHTLSSPIDGEYPDLTIQDEVLTGGSFNFVHSWHDRGDTDNNIQWWYSVLYKIEKARQLLRDYQEEVEWKIIPDYYYCQWKINPDNRDGK